MKKNLDTNDVIENLVSATLSESASFRQRHVFRENLRNLVRLAQAEKIVEIKENVQRLSGNLNAHSARRHAKAILLAQRLPGFLQGSQQHFEFK
jgi:hypothetical protein